MKFKKYINYKLFIGLLMLLVVLISYSNTLNISIKKTPRQHINQSINTTIKSAIKTEQSFIPDIKQKSIKKSIINDGCFDIKDKFNIKDLNTKNTYTIEKIFKKDYIDKKAESNIDIIVNGNQRLILNGQITSNNFYLYCPNIYPERINIDLQQYGKKLYNSNLLSDEYRSMMSEKNINDMKSKKINLFTYPGTIEELKEYILSYIGININSIFKDENIIVEKLNNSLECKGNNISKYIVSSTDFEFKYLLISGFNSLENLIKIYDSNLNFNFDAKEFHSNFQEFADSIINQYNNDGKIEAIFYIDNKNTLKKLSINSITSYNVLDNKEKTDKQNIVTLEFKGKFNPTDNIKFLAFNKKGDSLIYERNLECSEKNIIKTDLIYNNKNIFDKVSIYNPENKKLFVDIKGLTPNENIDEFLLIGYLSNIENNSFKFNIENLKLKTSDKNIELIGEKTIKFEKPTIEIDTTGKDVFEMSYEEFQNMKTISEKIINDYIPIDNIRTKLYSFKIFREFRNSEY